MGIQRIGVTSLGTSGYQTSLTVSISSLGHKAGDLLIAIHGVGVAATPSNPPAPSGFTRFGWAPSNSGGATYMTASWKISDGTETSVVFNTQANDNTSHCGIVVAYRGMRREAPSGANFPTGDGISGSIATGPTMSSVPTFGALNLNIALLAATSSSTCTVTGTNWSEIVDHIGGGSIYRNLVLAENAVNSGSVTGATFTFTQNATRRTAACCYLVPAPVEAGLLMSL